MQLTARGFPKEGHCSYEPDEIIKQQHRFDSWLVTPKLMGRVAIRLCRAGAAGPAPVIAAMLCVLSLPASAQEVSSLLQGTYTVSLCEEKCLVSDSSNAEISGILVLADSSRIAQGIPSAVIDSLSRDPALVFLLDSPRGPATACFVLEFFDRRRQAGLTRSMLLPTDSVVVPIYRSPDGGWNIIAAFSASGFEGHGVTWHYPDVPTHDWGYAYGRRIGPPEPERCAAAAGG